MDISKLTATEKTAIVMLALGENEAARILRELPAQEAQRVLRALSRMQSVDDATAAAVLAEFTAKVQQDSPRMAEGSTFAANLIDRTFSRDEATRLKELTATPPGLPALEGLEDHAVTQVLREERPQTGALILAHLSSARAAAIIRPLPAALQTDILTRVARLEPVEAEVLASLNEALLAVQQQQSRVHTFDRGGPQAIAALLNQLPSDAATAQLNAIADRDPDLAEAVREQMFTFHDLIRLRRSDMAIVLQKTNQATLHLAMRAAREGLWQLLRESMSERAFNLFREDFEAQPKALRQDVEQAQSQIADQVRQMIQEGTINLQSPDEVWV